MKQSPFHPGYTDSLSSMPVSCEHRHHRQAGGRWAWQSRALAPASTSLRGFLEQQWCSHRFAWAGQQGLVEPPELRGTAHGFVAQRGHPGPTRARPCVS